MMLNNLLGFLALSSLATGFCPPYGPTFPPPQKLSKSKVVQDALAKLTSTLDAALATGNSTHGPNDPNSAHAVQIFSLDEEKPLYEYYYDGAYLAAPGVTKIDGDSIWRIGSISKVLTLYLVLIELGEEAWSKKLIDVVPELKGRDKSNEDPLRYTNWGAITLGQLGAHLAGNAASQVQLGSTLYSNPTQYGFPALNETEMPPCQASGLTVTCTRKEILDLLPNVQQPIYRPNTTPIYGNSQILLLSYALESLTGKSYKELLQSVLIDRLGLTATSYSKPDDSRGIIPNISSTFWYMDIGELTPFGGVFSSLNDVAKIARSILNSTLLDATATRGWLKPVSFNGNLLSATGRPWEIYRVAGVLPDQVIDIYSKGGDGGPYKTYIAIVPDLKIGFVAGVAGTRTHRWMDGLLVDIVFPALQEAAREQADTDYSGTYKATNGLNSSLTLRTEAGKPGVLISEWISNGTDFLGALQTLNGWKRDLRLFPTNLDREVGDGVEVAWRAAPDLISGNPEDDHGTWSACRTWFNIDATTYGNHAIDEVVFRLNGSGHAISVESWALKVVLDRSTG